jgi:hypothetical protein
LAVLEDDEGAFDEAINVAGVDLGLFAAGLEVIFFFTTEPLDGFLSLVIKLLAETAELLLGLFFELRYF